MFNVEKLAINGGALAPGATVKVDMPISARWVKIAYVKLVQLTAGTMEVELDIWETDTYNAGVRTDFYKRRFRRNINQTLAQGGEYGEAVSPMVPFKDRDDPGEERGYALHIRLKNGLAGTGSDFDLVITLADIGEGA